MPDSSPSPEADVRPTGPQAVSGQPLQTIKPVMAALVFRHTAGKMMGMTILLAFVAVPLTLAQVSVPWVLVGLSYLVLLGFGLIQAGVRARRLWWELGPVRIRGGSGTLFSHFATELDLPRITQVTLFRPYLENRILGTGSVEVKAAGSGVSHLVLSPVAQPEQVFRQLQDLMAGAGFSLQRGRTVQEERPALVECTWYLGRLVLRRAVVLAVVVFVGAVALGLALGLDVAPAAAGELLSIIQGDSPIPEAAPEWLTAALVERIPSALAAFLVLGLLWAVLPPGAGFVRMRSRRYRLFDDVVELEWGVFSRNRQVIPMENLSDVSVRQAFRQRLMGTADLQLSCQGRGRTIHFPWMARAGEFSTNLKTILENGVPDRAAGQPAPSAQAPPTAQAPPAAQGSHASIDTGGEEAPVLSAEPPVELKVVVSRVLTGQFLRALGEGLAFLMFFVLPAAGFLYFLTGVTDLPEIAELVSEYERWIVIGVVAGALLSPVSFFLRLPMRVVRMRAIRYRMDAREVEGSFALLSRESRRFALHRVTAVAIRSGILDRLFGTTSVTFHAIGSGRPITFGFVPAAEVDLASLTRRLGLTPGSGDTPRVVHARVSPGLWFLAHPWMVTLTALWVIVTLPFALLHPLVLLVPLVAVAAMLKQFVMEVWDAGSGKMELGRDHVTVFRGRLRRRVFLTAYRDVRVVRTYRYAFSPSGTVQVQVAGGRGAALQYVQDPDSLHLELDRALLRYPPQGGPGSQELDTSEILSIRPMARNAIISLTIASVLLFPFLVFYPLFFILTFVQLRQTRYTLEKDRIMSTSGIVARRAHSILYNRIDSVSTSRGMLNGFLDNGRVLISTAARAGAQMAFQNVRDEEGVAAKVTERMAAHEKPAGRSPPDAVSPVGIDFAEGLAGSKIGT